MFGLLRVRRGPIRRWSSSLQKRLLPKGMEENIAYKHALNYTHYYNAYRLGRSSVTKPRVFSRAFEMMEKAAYHAQRQFNSPLFKIQLALMPKSEREAVVRSYHNTLKNAARMRMLMRKDMLRHHQTPAVLSRRAFTEVLREKLEEEKHENGFTFGMLDLDDFKDVNTRWGHPAGDAVLDAFSIKLGQFFRSRGGDVGRVGGEEFQFYLPNSPRKAKVLLEDLRREFKVQSGQADFLTRNGAELVRGTPHWDRNVSFTAGIVGWEPNQLVSKKLGTLFSRVAEGIKVGKTHQRKGKTIIVGE